MLRKAGRSRRASSSGQLRMGIQSHGMGQFYCVVAADWQWRRMSRRGRNQAWNKCRAH